MLIVALFIVGRNWKQPRCLLVDEWMNKIYIYTMEFYSPVKGQIDIKKFEDK